MSEIHEAVSELAGKTVKIHCDDDPQKLNGQEYRVEDWWDRIAGESWMNCNGNPACLHYAMRTGLSTNRPPLDNEVLYGHTRDGLGHLVHFTEVEAAKS